MANDKQKINILRRKLENSIINNEDYSVIYTLSVELDKLIAQYYKKTLLENKISPNC